MAVSIYSSGVRMKSNQTKTWLTRTTVLASFAGALLAPISYAQDTTTETGDAAETIESVSDDASGVQEKIIVTGSRIVRDEFSSTAPLQVINSETIRESGLIDIGDILQTSSVVSGTQFDGAVTANGILSDNGPGGQSIGLRGLDASRTLVMVNGRRYAPAGVEGAPSSPDVSLLPSSMVDRIDILLDGASSVYGSDAIAGVVNVILRDDYEGFNVEAYVNQTIEGGGESSRFNFIWGEQGETGGFVLAGEYLREEELKTDDRDWGYNSTLGANCEQSFSYTADGIVGECDAAQTGIGITQPAFFLYYGVPGISAEDSDLGFGRDGLTGVANFVNGRGDLAVDPVHPDRWEINTILANQSFDMAPAFEKTSIFLTGNKQINVFGLDTEVFTEFSFTNRQTDVDEGYGQFTVPLPASNPFNPFGDNALPNTAGSDDGFGPQDTSSLLLRPWEDSLKVELDQYRLIGGLRGDYQLLGDTWTYETFAGYTRSQGYSERTGVNEINLALSVYTVEFDEANDTFNCGLPNIDDNFGGFFGLDLETCVPINYFAPSLFSANPTFSEGDIALDYIREVRTVSTFIDETIVGGYTTGKLFDLPAGELQGVIGFEWRKDSIDTRSDAVTQRGILDGFFFDEPTVGSVSLGEVYGELYIPLVNDVPGVENLEMEVAGRFIDHEFYGQNSTYSVKGSYSPVNWLTFRSTYGTSFRAPNLRELFLQGTSSFQSAPDPCEVPDIARDFDPDTGNPFYVPEDDTRDPQVLANCVAEGLDPTTLALRGGSTSFQAKSAGNTGLDPEESTAISAGFVFEQPWFEGFEFAIGLNYFDIEVENTIYEPGLGQILTACYNSGNFPNDPFCTRRQRDATTGFLTEVDVTPFNIASQEVSGYDFNANFEFELDVMSTPVTFESDLEVTKLDTLRRTITFPGSEPLVEDYIGIFGTTANPFSGSPEWRATFRQTADFNDFTLFWQTRYIDVLTDDDPPSVDAVSQDDVGLAAVVKTSPYFVHDASFSYNAESWNMRVGVQNVFDEAPPQVDNETTGAISVRNVPLGQGYDVYGRRVFVSIAKEF